MEAIYIESMIFKKLICKIVYKSFIYPFIKRMYIEYIRYAKNFSRHWGDSRKDKQ